MIEEHAGDRPTLDLIIDGADRGNGDQLELSRKLAFRGNSGLYGVQARTRFKCAMLAPHPNQPDVLDMVDINGYVDFRRLRPHACAGQSSSFGRGARGQDPIQEPEWEPIEPGVNGDRSRIIHSLTRGALPEIQAGHDLGWNRLCAGAGPVGNEGAFDCYWGEFMRSAASRYREREGDIGEFGAAITAPSEQLVFDLIVHRDLEFALKPEVMVFGRIFRTVSRPAGRTILRCCRFVRPPIDLHGSPPIVNTPLVPRYPQLLRKVYDRLDWNPQDFRGIRLLMKYPPLGQT